MSLPDSQPTGNTAPSHVYINSNLLTSDQFNLITTISGSNDSQSILNYFAGVQEIAEHFGWSSKSKYLAVKLRLTGEALHFIREQHFNISDYDSLKKGLIARFSSQSNKARLVHEFFSFQQPQDLPLSVFFDKATALSFKAFCTGESDKETEETVSINNLKSMLTTNLTPEILRKVTAPNPKTLEDIKVAALLQKRAWNVLVALSLRLSFPQRNFP